VVSPLLSPKRGPGSIPTMDRTFRKTTERVFVADPLTTCKGVGWWLVSFWGFGTGYLFFLLFFCILYKH
jgi:hypothetical protein